MTINRILPRIAVAMLVLLTAAAALAQNDGVRGVQLFAPADISPYGNGPQAHEGYFFSFDELYWSTSKANVVLIGDPNPRLVGTSVIPVVQLSTGNFVGELLFQERFNIETSSTDTSRFESRSVGGERVEFGRVADGYGWEFSILRLRENNQQFTVTDAPVEFIDPAVNPAPGNIFNPIQPRLFGQIGTGLQVTAINSTGGITATSPVRVEANLSSQFSLLTAMDQTKMWGLETNLVRRIKPLHDGSRLEFYFGPRYLEFEDNFLVFGAGGSLDTSEWYTIAENHIVGPQIGVHYFKQNGRFIFSAEGRFLAGYNRQNITQTGFLGSNIVTGSLGRPNSWPGDGFQNHATFNEFSPVVELRLDLKYVLTRTFNLRAGWTGLWVDNVRRGENLNIYQLPTMGIDPSHDKLQDVFFNGLSVGAEFNR